MTAVIGTVVTRRAAAAVTGGASRPRPAAHTARAWIDTRTARAGPLAASGSQPSPPPHGKVISPMTTLGRFGVGIISAILLTAAVLAKPPAAQARVFTIKPGERIDYINSTGDNKFCTIGHVYTGSDAPP